jgi:N-dimethylarginine dimethylaminohydrolase
MVAPLRTVAVKRPEEAFRAPDMIRREWAALGYLQAPNYEGACREHRRLVGILERAGAEVLCLPTHPETTLDSLYAHDPVLVTAEGAVLLRMGKPDRRGEVPALGDSLRAWGVPVLGAIEGEGTAEAGDMIWLDEATLLVGRGFRTNAEGIRQLAVLLGPMGIDIVPLHLPYDNGPGKVLHLMSFISLLDLDLAIVCRRLLPVPLYEILTDRGVRLVDVPDAEYATMGTNVLALGPRNLVMVSGNPVTRERLEAAGCQVTEIEGRQICIPGAGGPTCLTRPIWRK